MKRVFALLLALTIVFCAAACGSSQPSAEPAQEESANGIDAPTPAPVPTPVPVDTMRDILGAMIEYCLTNEISSWTPTVRDHDAVHFALNVYANHCFADNAPLAEGAFDRTFFAVDRAPLREAAQAMFPDYQGEIPGENDTDPYYQWFWIVPNGEDQFAVSMGDEGQWTGDLEASEQGSDGTVTAEFAIVEYSSSTRLGVCRAQLLPNSAESKFGYIVQNIEIDLTKEQELAAQEQNPIGWFTTVGGTSFFLPEGFQIETRPNGPRGLGLRFYYFYNPTTDMRIDVSEFLNASGYAQEGDWLQEQYDGFKQSFSSTMTYDTRYDGGFAVSGVQDGRIYYYRGWESSDNKGILFTIDYPESQASVCNDVVTQFFESFTPPQN